MNYKNNINAVLQQFGFSRAITHEIITTYLRDNSTELIMTMEKPVIKDTKKRLASVVESNVNAKTQVECALQKIQAIEFMSRYAQDTSNRGLTLEMTLLQDIDTECANLYKSVQRDLRPNQVHMTPR